MKLFPIIPIWIMLIICEINLRIMIPSNNSKTIKNNLDVLFVIDNTISMNALDYNGSNTRLSGVKEACNYIIDELNGSRFSVITFDNTSRIVTPYTYDANITREAISIMMPINELYAKGSSIDVSLDSIMYSLKNSKKKNDNNRIIFFISDGENTSNNSIKSFKSISKYISDGAVLGYGTKKGGYMKDESEYATNEYIMDYTGTNFGKAISKIDEKNLKEIANDMDVDYIHVTNSNDINSKIKQIKNKTKSTLESNDKSSYDDIYYIFVIPLLILLFIEFDRFRRRII